MSDREPPPVGPQPLDGPQGPEVEGFGTLTFVARGGSATVYRTTRLSNGADLAIKVFDGDARRVARELDARHRLDGARHVLQVVDHGQLRDGRSWIATPFATFGTAETLRSAGPVPVELVTKIGVQTAHALVLAHDAGIVHADIKPSNLFVDADGDVLLGDFGSAFDNFDPSDDATMAVTLLYTSPEVLSGESPTARSDIYSLGLTMYALATGSLPFDEVADDGLAPLATRITSGPAPELPPTSPRWLHDIVARCTALQPEDRYGDAQEVAADLMGHRPGAAPKSGTRPPQRKARRRKMLVAVAATVVVAAAALLWAGSARTPQRLAAPSAAPAAWQRQVAGGAGSPGGGYDSSAAVDSNGRPVVAHTDLATGRLLLTRCTDPTCTASRTRVLDPGPRSGYYPSLRLTRDNRPVIAYQDSGDGALVVRRCSDRQCSRSVASQVPLPPGLSGTLRLRFAAPRPGPLDRNQSLVPRLVLRDDVPVLTFDEVSPDVPGEDTPRSQVWLAQCTDASCSSWTSRPLAAGAVPSLALDPAGRPVVAGTGLILGNLSFGRVWIVQCADVACSTTTTTDGSVAASTVAVAVGPDGGTTVVGTSYLAASEPDGLWVVACTTGCPQASVRTLKIAERAKPDGYPSVAVLDGRPVVAFLAKSGTPAGVSLIKCADPLCGPGSSTVVVNALVPQSEQVLDGGDDPSLSVRGDRVVVSSSRFPSGDRRARLVVAGVPAAAFG